MWTALLAKISIPKKTSGRRRNNGHATDGLTWAELVGMDQELMARPPAIKANN